MFLCFYNHLRMKRMMISRKMSRIPFEITFIWSIIFQLTSHPFVYSLSQDNFKVNVVVQHILVYPTTAWFNCSVDKSIPDAQLQTIKWFKDDSHFYTYHGNDDRISVKTLINEGITDFDVEASKEGNVLLSRTNLNTTGTFRCEVTLMDGRIADAQQFVTSIYLPLGGGYPEMSINPRIPIMVPKMQDIQIVIVSVGDYINVTCHSMESFPRSHLFLKINGFRVEQKDLIDLQETISVSWEGIRGIPFHNKLLTTTISTRIKVKESQAIRGFMYLTCSSLLSIDNHGFLHQQDSETERIRVLTPKPRVYVDAKVERYRVWFYGFFAVTILALIWNYYWVKNQAKRAAKNEKDKKCKMKHSNSDAELLRQMSISEDPSRRPSLYGPRR